MFDTGVVVSAVDQLTASIDTLLDTDAAYDSLGRDELLDVVRRVETQRRRFAALDQVLLARLDARGVATEVGLRNTAGLLRAMLRLSPAEASTRVRAAKACGPRRALDGQPLPPLRPVIAAAQREGTVSVEQAALITRVLAGLPAAVPAEVVDRVETTLVEHAHTFDPHALSVIAGRITDTLDPDGSLTDDAEHQRQRQFSLRQRPDGSFDLRGRLTPECGAAWQSVLTPLAAPGTGEGASPADARTPAQRLHDGFYDAAMRLLRGGLPGAGGIPTTIVLTLSLEQLETRSGVITTAHGGTLTVAQALRLAAQARAIPVLFTDTGGVLSFGRARRFASTGQTYAMYARDLRCTFPGCDQPAAWCEHDHTPAWIDGAHTDINQMHLTCRLHNQPHRRAGWTPAMIDGIPHWRPPPWIDPAQALQRNPQPERTPSDP